MVIKGVDAVSILSSWAKKWNSEVDKNDIEYCFDLAKEYGSGFVKAYGFKYGISVLVVDIKLKQKLELRVRFKESQPLQLIFNREDHLIFNLEGESSAQTLERFECLMASSSHKSQFSLVLKPDSSLSFFAILINRQEFEAKLADYSEGMDDDLKEIFWDLKGINTVAFKIFYSLEISKLIEDFLYSELQEDMKGIFLEGKSYEIIANYISLYLDNLKDPNKRKLLRRHTVLKIEEAAKYISNHIDSVLSVSRLAKEVQINKNTLQLGFKRMFDQSVNDYIRDQRLEEAKLLFETTDLNITEVTYKVGINSRSYFSKIFKKKFNITPSEFLKRRKKSRSA